MQENNYSFTVIEDGAVPMAGFSQTNDYFVLALVGIVVVTVVLFLLIYTIWYSEHKKRIRKLKANLAEYDEEKASMTTPVSIFHPREFLETEKQLEQSLAGYYMKQVTNKLKAGNEK